MSTHGKEAVELLTANPLAGYCLAINEQIKQPAVLFPHSATQDLMAKPQRAIFAWLGFTPATEALAKVGRKCIPEALNIERCQRLLRTWRLAEVRELLAHVPRINAGVLALVSQREILPYLTPQLLLEVANNRAEELHPECVEWLIDLRDKQFELGQESRAPKCTSVAQIRVLRQRLGTEIIRCGGRIHRGLAFPAAPLPELNTKTLSITPITTIGGLRGLGEIQHNCVATYALSVTNGKRYVYKVTMNGKAYTLCLAIDPYCMWQVFELKGMSNCSAPSAVVQAVQQWLQTA